MSEKDVLNQASGTNSAFVQTGLKRKMAEINFNNREG